MGYSDVDDLKLVIFFVTSMFLFSKNDSEKSSSLTQWSGIFIFPIIYSITYL